MKHVQKMMLVPEHLLQSLETEHRLTSPPQLATLTRLDQDMKQIMDSSLPEDQKISLLDQLLHRYQGLSRQMKSEATVKPTVTATVSPAPTETSPTTRLEKTKKVLSRKLPATPKSTATTGLSKSKIPRTVVRSASSGKQTPPSETIPVPETLQSTPASQSKILVAKVDEPVLPEVPAFLLETPLSTPTRKRRITRKPRTPVVARLRSNRQWEPY